MIQYPYSQEREYQRFVKIIFTSAARIAQGAIIPNIGKWTAIRKDEEDPQKESSFAEELALLIYLLLFIGKINLMQKMALLDIAKSVSTFTAKQLQLSLEKQYGISIPYVAKKTAIADWIYIQSITIDGRIQQFANGVNQAVSNGVMNGLPKTEIVGDIKKLSDKLIDGAAFVAGNGVGNLAGDTSKNMMEDAGIYKYAWITQRDERVRPAHKARHGKIFDWRKPPDDGHPGQPYLCRCVASPMIEKDQKLEIGITPKNAYDLTVYRKGVTGTQRPERAKKYAAILRSGVMSANEIKELAANPSAADSIYEKIIMSGRYSSDALQKLKG